MTARKQARSDSRPVIATKSKKKKTPRKKSPYERMCEHSNDQLSYGRQFRQQETRLLRSRLVELFPVQSESLEFLREQVGRFLAATTEPINGVTGARLIDSVFPRSNTGSNVAKDTLVIGPLSPLPELVATENVDDIETTDSDSQDADFTATDLLFLSQSLGEDTSAATPHPVSTVTPAPPGDPPPPPVEPAQVVARNPNQDHGFVLAVDLRTSASFKMHRVAAWFVTEREVEVAWKDSVILAADLPTDIVSSAAIRDVDVEPRVDTRVGDACARQAALHAFERFEAPVQIVISVVRRIVEFQRYRGRLYALLLWANTREPSANVAHEAIHAFNVRRFREHNYIQN